MDANAPKCTPTIEQVGLMQARLLVIRQEFDKIKAALVCPIDDPEISAQVVSRNAPPRQSFREAKHYGGTLYIRDIKIADVLADALEACRDDAHANVRWALDRHLITEATAADYLAHFKA